MNAVQLAQIALAPWRQRDRDSPWGRRLIAALLALGAIAAVIFLPPAAKWRAVLCLVILVLMGGWMALGANLQEQNHPTAAHCVPGHLAALRRAALLCWAGCTALVSLLLWLIIPGTSHGALILLGTSAVATFLLWSTRLWWLWLLLLFTWQPLLLWAAAPLAPLGRAIAALWQANTAGMLLLSLLAQGWIVASAFAGGGARHQSRYTRQSIMRNAMRMRAQGGQVPAVAAWGNQLAWIFRPFERLFQAWQQRLVARADNGNLHSVMARAAIVLHGQQHWLKLVMGIAAMVGLALLAFIGFWLVYRFDMAAMLVAGSFGIGMAIANIGLNPAIALPTALWHSRREQALLRLLPGMPQGEALNRAVARLQWRNFLAAWLLCELALAALAACSDKSLMLYLPLAALPCAALSLTRRPATMRPVTPMTVIVPVFASMALWGGLLVLVQPLGVPPWLVAATVVIVSALLLAWRWRRLVAAPVALPAGRLG